jgi:tetratricopeptide (TPR) repeat protein
MDAFDSEDDAMTSLEDESLPLGRRLARIRQILDGLLDKGEVGDRWQALSTEEHELEGIVIDRNLEGVALERQGDKEGAIELYEQNVMDEVDTPHPYARLAVIYREEERVDDEIRVLEKAIALFGDIDPWRERLATVRKAMGRGSDRQDAIWDRL